MRLGIAEWEGKRRVALEADGSVLDLAAVARADPTPIAKEIAKAATVEDLLRLGPAAWTWLEGLHEDAPSYEKPGQRLSKVRWRSPLTAPQKICCIGLNYLDHCKEQNVEPPKSPMLFAKFPTAIVGPGDPIVWSPALTQKVDWEAELAIVIGKKARQVPKAKARDAVAGYVAANDVTARDLQKGDGQWIRGKSLDTFCPLGPHLVSADEVPDPERLRIQCRVNGTTKQDSNTRNLIFGVNELVAFLSNAFTLLPGDVILTGTPPGVGVFRKPPEFLGNGDRVEVEIESLGVLPNECRTTS